MRDVVRITDLAAPGFTPAVDEIRSLMASMADACVLAPDALHAQACAESGLEDFGDRSYEAPLAALVEAIDDWRALSPVGRVVVHTQLVQLLKNRLLLTDLLGRHPEIHEIEVVAPIVIAGLPRTGTTHLHNLMAADPALRSLPYWESLEPIPARAEIGVEPDPRLARTDQAVSFMNEAMPLFSLMHEISTGTSTRRSSCWPSTSRRCSSRPWPTYLRGATTTWPTIRRLTTATCERSCKLCSTSAAADGGCSSRPSTSSSSWR